MPGATTRRQASRSVERGHLPSRARLLCRMRACHAVVPRPGHEGRSRPILGRLCQTPFPLRSEKLRSKRRPLLAFLNRRIRASNLYYACSETVSLRQRENPQKSFGHNYCRSSDLRSNESHGVDTTSPARSGRLFGVCYLVRSANCRDLHRAEAMGSDDRRARKCQACG